MPPRNRISLEQRERIIRAFEDNSEDYVTVAVTIGVNRSTARSIVTRYLREGRIAERPRGGANHLRVDNDMRDCLEEILNENYLLTFAQINQELRQRLPGKPIIHDRTVARTLDGMLYSVKLGRPLPAESDRHDVLQQRVDYANWFMRHAVVNHSVFVGECGFNIWTARNHGNARTGERAYRQVCGQRGRNVTITLAVSPVNGLVFHSETLGGMNGPKFGDFLAQARLNLDPNEQVIFIYDGAPAHDNPALSVPNSELKRLPPYSPFLNIVEQATKALKSAIKADISRPEMRQEMNNRAEAIRQGIALGNYRSQLLLQVLQRNIATITTTKCEQWYRIMQTYLPRSFKNEEIEG